MCVLNVCDAGTATASRDPHHTDAEREWAYDRTSHIGRLARGLDAAPIRGWILVDMKRDWKVIHPFQK